MLRHYLDQPRLAAGDYPLGRYLDKIRIFISHSKHDQDGVSVGSDIRNWIHMHSPLASFFDFYDIPAGLPFEDILLHEIGSSALLAIHTDSYSSREWCRREIIEAKRRMVPMVVVNCVRDVDPCMMPYLGNVPCVRMSPTNTDRIGIVVGCLLDEIFRSWLWLCRVAPHCADSPMVLFTPRPPELIALAAMPSCAEDKVSTIVYPEPPLVAEEEQLFREIAPKIRMQTLTDWLEQNR